MDVVGEEVRIVCSRSLTVVIKDNGRLEDRLEERRRNESLTQVSKE